MEMTWILYLLFLETLSGDKPAKVFLNEFKIKNGLKNSRFKGYFELYGNRLKEPQPKY